MGKTGLTASGQGIALGAAGVAALVAGGLYLGGAFTVSPPSDGAPGSAPADAPVAERAMPEAVPDAPVDAPVKAPVEASPADAADEAAAPAPAALPDPPQIDLFRLEPDGAMLIAGSTQPGWATDILLDGRALSPVSADGNGQFVQFVTLPFSDAPRVLSLRMTAPESGATLDSPQDVIIAPTPEPVALAEADPDAARAPRTTPPAAAPATRPADVTGETAPALPDAGQLARDTDPAQASPEAPKAPDIAALPQPTTRPAAAPSDPARADTQTPEVQMGQVVPDAREGEPSQMPTALPQAGTDTPSQPQVADSAGSQAPSPAQTAAAPAMPAPGNPQAQPAPSGIATVDPRQPRADPPRDTDTPAATPGGDARPAPMSQTVLLADDSGVKVLQRPAPPQGAPRAMSSVALDAITYSDAGQVELAGRAVGEGFVRVYLDNAPITTSRISEGGNWRTDLPQVDTGVYTLRIDEVDSAGTVTSRVETPFKREDAEVLAAVEAESAAPRIRAVTVQPGSTLWAISREAYGQGILYVRVFQANADRIRDPDLIYPGQVFTLPE